MVQQILNVIAENCVVIACDKSGCCILQQIMSHAVGESRRFLIAQIISNALHLSQHPFGYVLLLFLFLFLYNLAACNYNYIF